MKKTDLADMLHEKIGGTKKLFISGIPTAGKSYLAEKLAKEVGGIRISIDDLREGLAEDPRYKKWVNFYLDQDEYTYYTTIDYNQQWKNLVKQSEEIWGGLFEKMMELNQNDKPIIFEGVNILPHLAKKYLSFPGIILTGKSFEEVFERNKKDPRWGKTEELQRLEANAFFHGERAHYEEEAEKYGYPVFETAEAAYDTALKFLKYGSLTEKKTLYQA